MDEATYMERILGMARSYPKPATPAEQYAKPMQALPDEQPSTNPLQSGYDLASFSPDPRLKAAGMALGATGDIFAYFQDRKARQEKKRYRKKLEGRQDRAYGYAVLDDAAARSDTARSREAARAAAIADYLRKLKMGG